MIYSQNPHRPVVSQRSLALAALLLCPLMAHAGPPFITDDPEPVEYQHWEVYGASQNIKTNNGWSGTGPHVEVNYGVIPEMQLHVILPMAYAAPSQGPNHYGYGDTELGLKYRFLKESDYFPQVGVFPLLEIPTGNANEGLGTGHLQIFLPLWAQKDFGKWTIYGGGGYDINPGGANRNWVFTGVVAQYQLLENLALGGELYNRTSPQVGLPDDTAFNLGGILDFNEHTHLLFSAGRSIRGPTSFQTYLALQFTF